MRTTSVSTILLLLSTHAAMAHGYHAGEIEIVHPTIMVPPPKGDCSCAHVKIINHGTKPEYFLGAAISAAARTDLIEISAGQGGIGLPARVEILPGQALDLSRHHWCLFMSGITTSLEADMGVIAGELRFENAGTVEVEFMIDAR